MSRILTTFTFLFFVFAMSAQVVNGDFEQISSNGAMAHWGRIYIFSVTIDTNGMNPDTFDFDGKLFQPTSDAHTGNWALELRNAHNFFTGQSIDGGASSYADSLFSGFSALNSVEPGTRPTSLNFFYKYLPVGNDLGYANLILYDYNFNELGTAEIVISGEGDEYSLATAQVNYAVDGEVVYYSLTFTTSAPGSDISFGTRLLIDDVTFGITNSSKKIEKNNFNSNIYPNPSNSTINIKDKDHPSMVIFNSEGRKVKTVSSFPVDISDLPAGTYYLKSQDKFNSKSFQFVVH